MVHHVESDDIAEALVDVAQDVGGLLLVGPSRNRVLQRYIVDGVPDKAID